MALVVKNPSAKSGDKRDSVLTPESQRPSRGGCGNSLQYSCLENPMERGAWHATVHGIAESRSRLRQLSTQHVKGMLWKSLSTSWSVINKDLLHHWRSQIMEPLPLSKAHESLQPQLRTWNLQCSLGSVWDKTLHASYLSPWNSSQADPAKQWRWSLNHTYHASVGLS